MIQAKLAQNGAKGSEVLWSRAPFEIFSILHGSMLAKNGLKLSCLDIWLLPTKSTLTVRGYVLSTKRKHQCEKW